MNTNTEGAALTEAASKFAKGRDDAAGDAFIRGALWMQSRAPSSQPQEETRLTLDTPERVCFYEQDHYYLSNFSAFRLVYRGIDFDTSEHAYHYQKFPDASGIQQAICMASSAHEAFKVAERERNSRREDWDDIKIEVMKAILWAKVQQHEYVRRKLLETGTRELVENSWRDGYWGWGPNRDGQNMLGKLWMEVRAELVAGQPPSAQSAECTECRGSKWVFVRHGAEDLPSPCSTCSPDCATPSSTSGVFTQPFQDSGLPLSDLVHKLPPKSVAKRIAAQKGKPNPFNVEPPSPASEPAAECGEPGCVNGYVPAFGGQYRCMQCLARDQAANPSSEKGEAETREGAPWNRYGRRELYNLLQISGQENECQREALRNLDAAYQRLRASPAACEPKLIPMTHVIYDSVGKIYAPVKEPTDLVVVSKADLPAACEGRRSVPVVPDVCVDTGGDISIEWYVDKRNLVSISTDGKSLWSAWAIGGVSGSTSWPVADSTPAVVTDALARLTPAVAKE